MTFATRFNITKGYLAFTGVYFLTFVLGLAIIGLYATDVQRAKEENAKLNSKWVCHYHCPRRQQSKTRREMLTDIQIFAVVVGGLSSVTSLVYAVPFLFHAITIIAPVWNLILFVLNITLFGVFAKVCLTPRAVISAVANRAKRGQTKTDRVAALPPRARQRHRHPHAQRHLGRPRLRPLLVRPHHRLRRLLVEAPRHPHPLHRPCPRLDETVLLHLTESFVGAGPLGYHNDHKLAAAGSIPLQADETKNNLCLKDTLLMRDEMRR